MKLSETQVGKSTRASRHSSRTPKNRASLINNSAIYLHIQPVSPTEKKAQTPVTDHRENNIAHALFVKDFLHEDGNNLGLLDVKSSFGFEQAA